MDQTVSNLLETVKKSKSFTVTRVGTFYPLIPLEEPTESKVFLVEYSGISPRYHRKRDETLVIISGKGILQSSNAKYLNQRSWNNMPKEDIDISPGSVVDIPMHTPHRMFVYPEYKPIVAVLTCKPSLNLEDEFKIRSFGTRKGRGAPSRDDEPTFF